MFHKNLANGGWGKLNLAAQLANVGSEFTRVSNLFSRRDAKNANDAIDRLLELIDLTITDARWTRQRSELIRLREVVADNVYHLNLYGNNENRLKNYFLDFALLTRS